MWSFFPSELPLYYFKYIVLMMLTGECDIEVFL